MTAGMLLLPSQHQGHMQVMRKQNMMDLGTLLQAVPVGPYCSQT